MSNSRRYREVLHTLSRHGIAYAATDPRNVRSWLPVHRGWLGHPRRAVPYSRPEHLRMALEELGPTFMKFGQLLSTRADLIPDDYRSELAKLQDAAPPESPESIMQTLRYELGASPSEIFMQFDPTPLASASIGQAHAARLHDGTEVVVKVRRSGAVETVAQDLQILSTLSKDAEARWDIAARFDVAAIVDEFAETLRAELDYEHEAKNAERFGRNFARSVTIHIPRVYWEFTTPRVLTLERVFGAKVSDDGGLDGPGIDRRSLAIEATRTVCKMIFEDGFFHADPHPGNFFIEAGGRLALIDFGMAGQVDPWLRGELAALLIAIVRDDTDRLTDAVLALSRGGEGVDRSRLGGDLELLVSRYRGRPIGQIPIAPLLGEALEVLRAHKLHLPRELALLIRMLTIVEGVGAQLDPEFHMGEVVSDYVSERVNEQAELIALLQRLAHVMGRLARSRDGLSRVFAGLRSTLSPSDFESRQRTEELQLLLDRLDRLESRQTTSLLASVAAASVIQVLLTTPSLRRSTWSRLGAIAVLTGLPPLINVAARRGTPRRCLPQCLDGTFMNKPCFGHAE